MAKGISKETRSKGSKKFKPSMDKQKGLSLSTVEWEIRRKESPTDSKQTSFIGGIVPQLILVFKGVTAKEGEEPAMYVHSYRPVEATETYKDSIEDGMFQTLKHFLEIALGRELTDTEYGFLSLDIPESPKGEEVLKGYDDFFKGVLKVLEPVNKPDIRKSDVWWVKLLRYIRTAKGDIKEVNRGDIGIPSYPGTGLFERFVQGVESSLEVNIAKGEDVEPKADIAPAATAPKNKEENKVTSDDMPDWLKKKNAAKTAPAEGTKSE